MSFLLPKLSDLGCAPLCCLFCQRYHSLASAFLSTYLIKSHWLVGEQGRPLVDQDTHHKAVQALVTFLFVCSEGRSHSGLLFDTTVCHWRGSIAECLCQGFCFYDETL